MNLGSTKPAVKRMEAPGKEPAPAKPAPSPAPPPGQGVPQITLTPSVPATGLSAASCLIYGEKKIGKTSLASKFPNAYFLMCEPGGKWLKIRKDDVSDWRTLAQLLNQAIVDPTIDTIVVDTMAKAYDYCFDYVLAKKKITTPNALPYGEGWKAIEEEFVDRMERLLKCGKGVIFTAHATIASFQSRDGSEYNKLIPELAKAALRFTSSSVDLIAYYGYYGRDRYLTLRGSEILEAGHRMEGYFQTPSGQALHSVPMGLTSQEAYNNFVRAFNNQQEDTCEPEEPTGLADAQVNKFKKSRN